MGGSQFTDADFEIRLVADTDQVVFSNNIAQNLVSFGDGTIALDGFAIGTFTELIWMFNNKTNEGVGFRGLPIIESIPDFLHVLRSNVGLDTYDLDTAFGPLPAPTFAVVAPGNPLSLDIGALSFNNVSGATFQAFLVPVPGAIWLFGCGLLGLVGMARRKQAA